jgi:hypothetical protein
VLVAHAWVTTGRPGLRNVALILGIVSVAWIWWPVRNLLLYGDPAGMSTLYRLTAERGDSAETLPTVFNVPDTYEALIFRAPWFSDTWKSVWLGEKAGVAFRCGS